MLYYGSPDMLGAVPWAQIRMAAVLLLLVAAVYAAWKICVTDVVKPAPD